MRTIIENIVTGTSPDGLGVSTFFWGEPNFMNQKLDEVPVDGVSAFPAVCMLPELYNGKPNPKGKGMIKKIYSTYIIVMMFIDTVELDHDQNTTGSSTVLAMRELAKQAVSKTMLYLQNNYQDQYSGVEEFFIGSLNPDDKNDFRWFFDYFDVNVTGVGLTMKVNITEPFEDCLK